MALAKKLLDGKAKVCAVIGFPLGAMSTAAKAFEAAEAIRDGADEIDMVIHIGQLKAGNTDYVLEDIKAVKAAIGDVRLFAEHVGEGVKIKAAGGIRSREDMEEFLRLGASRLGTSSAVKILCGKN